MFDANSKVIYNTSSIPYVFSSDNSHYVRVEQEETYERQKVQSEHDEGLTYVRVKMNHIHS